MDEKTLKAMKVAELRDLAKEAGVPNVAKQKKAELIEKILKLAPLLEAKKQKKAPAKKTAAKAKKAEEPTEAAKAEEKAPKKKAEEKPEAEEKPAPRRRGRPRKKAEEPKEEAVKEAASAEEAAEEEAPKAEAEEKPAPKKRGRPRKKPVEEPKEEPAEEVKAEEPAEPEEKEKEEPAPEKKDNRPEVTGILELADGGFGFLRFDNFMSSERDIYVSAQQIRRFNLKTGDKICGNTKKPGPTDKFGALIYVKTVNGDDPGVARNRPDFDRLTPVFPNERLTLETDPYDLSTRLIDLVAPIGKGQRGLIVAAPKAGKTVLLKKVADSIERNHPDVQLIVLLVDERPEEVTDMKRSLKSGEVVYSTFDEQPQHHIKVAEMVLSRAQRLAEQGKDVVILLDSITRLARAYNLVVPPSGRSLSGGLDPAALYRPKKFFGAARNIEEGGSVTILATALVETGSRMDDVIFEEFKGTGNMELHLDRRLSEKRIFPALDLNLSGTRREDLLLSQDEMEAVWRMRRALADGETQQTTELIIDYLSATRDNAQFVQIIKSGSAKL